MYLDRKLIPHTSLYYNGQDADVYHGRKTEGSTSGKREVTSGCDEYIYFNFGIFTRISLVRSLCLSTTTRTFIPPATYTEP